MDVHTRRYGTRIGGVGHTSEIEGQGHDNASAVVLGNGYMVFNSDKVGENAIGVGFASGWNTTDHVEGLVSHELTHMLQHGHSEKGAAAFKYSSAVAEQHVIDTQFGGSRSAYITERNKFGGYLAQDRNGSEAEAEMMSAYLHRADVPDWLKAWGAKFDETYHSNADFLHAYGYADTASDRPKPGRGSRDFPEEYFGDLEDLGGQARFVPPANEPPPLPYNHDLGENLAVARVTPGGMEMVLVHGPDGKTAQASRGAAPLVDFLLKRNYSVSSATSGAMHDQRYAAGWSPATLYFDNEADWRRFIDESGLNVQFMKAGERQPWQHDVPSSGYRNALAYGGRLEGHQVQLPPPQLAAVALRMWNREHGYNDSIPAIRDNTSSAGGTSGPGLNAPEATGGAEHVPEPPRMRPATDEDRARLKIPPKWRNVVVSDDPTSPLQAKGIDSKGRPQSRYTPEHHAIQADKKFARMKALHALLPKLDAALKRDAKTNGTAACVYLMRKMGVRNGSETDTGADTFAYGASNLRARHVLIKGDTVTLDFDAKDNVHLTLPVHDEGLKAILRARLRGLGPDDRVFDTNETKTNAYLKQYTSTEFKIKDLRTYLANEIALSVMVGMPKPTSKTEFRKWRLAVAKAVAEVLGNTPTVALGSYINPAVFASWTEDASWAS